MLFAVRLDVVRDIDSRVMLLREIEARIAFARHYVDEQREVVRRLDQMGLSMSVAHSLLRVMLDSLSILEQRRKDLLSNLERSGLGEENAVKPWLPPPE
jgi:hypothetical protein